MLKIIFDTLAEVTKPLDKAVCFYCLEELCNRTVLATHLAAFAELFIVRVTDVQTPQMARGMRYHKTIACKQVQLNNNSSKEIAPFLIQLMNLNVHDLKLILNITSGMASIIRSLDLMIKFFFTTTRKYVTRILFYWSIPNLYRVLSIVPIEVTKAAENCGMSLAVNFPPEILARALCPIVQNREFPVNQVIKTTYRYTKLLFIYCTHFSVQHNLA